MKNKIPPELIKGSAKNIILSVIAKKEMYGYEIVKSVSEQSRELLSLGEGTVYPILHQLEKDGLLSGRWAQQKDAPDRKYYKITKKGRRHLASALSRWSVFSSALNNIYRYESQR